MNESRQQELQDLVTSTCKTLVHAAKMEGLSLSHYFINDAAHVTVSMPSGSPGMFVANTKEILLADLDGSKNPITEILVTIEELADEARRKKAELAEMQPGRIRYFRYSGQSQVMLQQEWTHPRTGEAEWRMIPVHVEGCCGEKATAEIVEME